MPKVMDKDGYVEKEYLIPECLENIHDLIMVGRYKEACDIFEQWFHYIIGSGQNE